MSNHPNRSTRQQKVVTYRGAYLPREISLCDRHANDRDAGLSLGPVQHGRHRGYCAVCNRIDPQ